MVLLLGVGVAAFVYAMATPARTTIERDKITAAALAQARDALIGRAATDSTIPGSLPCPDLLTNIPGNNIPNDGSADLLAGSDCPSYIGRLPWRTLGLPDLRDGNGERLWYALSANFKDDSSASPLNSETLGQLTITGIAPASNVIAIVFSPGAIVGAQVRDTANENNISNYLEGGNETGISTNSFVAGQATSSFNDRLLPITSDALFSVVEMRVLREMRKALRAYRSNGSHPYFPGANPYSDGTYSCNYLTYQGRLPLDINLGCVELTNWDPATELPSWFGANNWQNVTYYAVSPCQVGIGVAISDAATALALPALCTAIGQPTVDGTPVDAIVFTAGRRISALLQSSPCASVSACLEGNNADGDKLFVSPVRSATNNDRILVVWP